VTASVPPVARRITQSQLLAYADASGDHNPIHIDEAFARTTPFDGTIAHGMLVLALIGEMMFSRFDEAWLSTGKLKVRFKAPTRPNDVVTTSAVFARQAGSVAEYAVQCVNQRGEVLIEGRAGVAVAE
jgi:acyl dehydratase